jgi:hypothetical protein
VWARATSPTQHIANNSNKEKKASPLSPLTV